MNLFILFSWLKICSALKKFHIDHLTMLKNRFSAFKLDFIRCRPKLDASHHNSQGKNAIRIAYFIELIIFPTLCTCLFVFWGGRATDHLTILWENILTVLGSKFTKNVQ